MTCAISGLVLKTADELAGNYAKGSTSHTSMITGTISRSFDVDSYFIAEGNATLNLIVKPSN